MTLLAHAGRAAARAGMVRLERPDRPLRALLDLQRWGATPAAGFSASARRFPDAPAVVDERGELSFAEIHGRSNALAHALADEGISAADTVAIMCRDHRWFIEAAIALSKLGASVLYFNTQFAGPQLEQVIEREQPAGLVYDSEFADALEGPASGLRRWVAWTDEESDAADATVEEMIEGGDHSDLTPPERPGRTVLLTSGSTGPPKGASRGQFTTVEPVAALLSRIPLRVREATVMAAPLFHAWGFLHFQLGMLLSSTYVLRRRFDPEATLARIAETGATALVIVPIMMQRILDLDEEVKQRYDTSSLRVVAASGGPLAGELSERWMDRFGDNLYNLYGSTEVAWAAIATPEQLRAAPGTSGSAPVGTSIKILGEDRQELPTGEAGEIFVGNQMLFEGYTGGSAEETVDGHMATGDLGRLDEEGRLFVEGRSDEMIVSGGENVYPGEVEETLEAHDAVKEAAVVGVEDEEFGQRLKAFVVVAGEVSEDDLKSHVKSNLANFKAPREVEFLDELPRNPQGKVVKGDLPGDEPEGEDAQGGQQNAPEVQREEGERGSAEGSR
jgi:acyl-CoA synthetase (AMP-forming)/AMP-acid ligase II